MIDRRLADLKAELQPYGATLVAVSKTQPVRVLEATYAAGQRDFGENRVPELVEKAEALPADIRWHFIGHLQTNKVKYIAPFVHFIHAVDSFKLLREINKRAAAHDRVIDVLLQFKIAEEATKYGYSAETLFDLLKNEAWRDLAHARIVGVMGMATYTNDREQIDREFSRLRTYFDRLQREHFGEAPHFKELSMGMSGDYPIALEHGGTLVRIGSKLFG